jgi:adenylate cyclase
MQPNQQNAPERVKAQLEKILESNTFKESERLKNFLRFVVEQTLDGKGDQLKQYTIATSAFDRSVKFDPQKDPIVRIQAGRLRQHLNKYYRMEGKNDTLLIEIPKGSYIPKFSGNENYAQNNNNNNDLTQTNEPSISVFPFKNLSGNESMQYVADGFTEELIMTLSLYKYITVIRAFHKINGDSSNSFSNQTSPSVQFLINGSIRFKGDKIKVIVTLTDAKSNKVIWGSEFFETYDLDGIIDIQETVTQNVAACIADAYGGVILKKRYSDTKQKTYKNIERFDAISHFYHYLRNPVHSEFNTVIHKLEGTVKKYPDFGAGWAALSDIYLNNYALGYFEGAHLLEHGIEYAKKGIRFDPDNQMTNTYMGYAYLINNQLNESIKQMQFARSLNPKSAFYIGAVGWVTALAGDWEQGMADIELSFELNPDYPKWYHLATTLYYLKENKFEDAVEEAIKFNIPELFWDPLLKTVTFALVGKQKEARESLDNLLRLKPGFEDKSTFYINMFVKFDDIRQLIYKGLQKAGLTLELLG